MDLGYYKGYKIIITTREKQNVKCRVKWINNLLAKLFGYTCYDIQELGELIFNDDIVYMTKYDYELIRDIYGGIK